MLLAARDIQPPECRNPVEQERSRRRQPDLSTSVTSVRASTEPSHCHLEVAVAVDLPELR
jgi:hypothetical protein